ncbi:MAG: PfkB family carbohydrate kinase [bacterium]|nr:PfkB family carbohydrate kinase [bacterium]
MTKVIVIGNIAYDELMVVNNRQIISKTTSPGGRAFNQAVTLARMNDSLQVYILSCIGLEDGDELKFYLTHEKIKNEFLISTNEFRTDYIHSENIDNNPEPIYYARVGASKSYSPSSLDAAKELFKTTSALVATFAIPIETLEYAYDLIKTNTKCITVLRPSPVNYNGQLCNLDNTSVKSIFEKTDYLVVSQSDIGELLNKQDATYEDASSLVNFVRKGIIVAINGLPRYYYGHDNSFYEINHNEHPLIIDTAGAMDVFTSVFVQRILDKKSLEDSIKYATGGAYICANRFGTYGSLPTLADIVGWESNGHQVELKKK